jgi:hypothetical protein
LETLNVAHYLPAYPMSANSSPIGCRGRITSTGAIQPRRTGEAMVSIVDNLTVLNGAQGISEIISQVIGQAGPALEMAQEALGRQNGAQPAVKLTRPEVQA